MAGARQLAQIYFSRSAFKFQIVAGGRCSLQITTCRQRSVAPRLRVGAYLPAAACRYCHGSTPAARWLSNKNLQLHKKK